MAKQISFNEFILKANILHNNKYDYSKTTFKNKCTEIIIVCPIHGDFLQIPKNHLYGSGCRICARKLVGEKTRITKEEYIKKANLVHNNKFDYTKTIYLHGRKAINIICPIHGEFTCMPHHHLRNYGCDQCYKDSYCWDQLSFIEESNKVHNNFYSYNKTIFEETRKKLIITCPKHGDFYQKPCHHLKGHGCQTCNSSKGEKAISIFLTNKNIEYIKEKSFNGCLGSKGWKLRFDFYLPKHNICIEFDGLQHDIKCDYFGKDSFDRVKIHDKTKTEYCNNNNLKLIRIKYKDFNNINTILTNEII